ncbi:hypothetical protein ANCCAN_04809 [Ancylostoma caninum]|uniref:Uncharacterized protein n=1 Tax=Ancylostoma caninum TaxID=29170 RepID=A0A368GXL2_ANCCA|nr:hypothetical protein ANCCAN_04809 [Ancylostoma caninum]
MASQVRAAAQTELFLVFSEYTLAREAVLDNLIAALTNENTNKAKIRDVDVPSILEVYEEIGTQIGQMQKPALKHHVRFRELALNMVSRTDTLVIISRSAKH